MNLRYTAAVVGADLTSNGGIASVVKAFCKQHASETPRNFDIYLLKTSHYKDGSKLDNYVLVFFALFKFLYKVVTTRRIIVHIHSSYGASFYRKSVFWLIAKLFRLPVILHLHSSKFDEFFLNAPKFKRKYINWILKNSDVVIALCNDWKRKLEQEFQLTNIVVVHNPIEHIYQPNQFEGTGELKILYMGFFIPSKGIEDLLLTAKRLSDDNTKFRLSIAGKGDLEDYIRTTIANLELEKNVNFVGWVSGEKKAELYKQTDVLFLPSYNEGMPMVILESLGHGIPVVSTDIAGIPDIVINSKNGFLHRPGEIEAFKESLKYFQTDRSRLTSFGAFSHSLAKEFSLPKFYGRVVDVYELLYIKHFATT
ncbi:glycosyltransferase family 4 protein [Pseudohalioglobus lutimaris]|uniref:Glycosyltransferase family 1 protein n=1 Tax=Pseudohalioglobus lutimaris TaxID=1737061 RepID=A0A2N5WXR4_9GAMM|nr:glycosyltransferase family 4 protein [Pseudohalioglobus lutimaris]PLW67039.1 hypothetical protein C0039_18655 [Pseudohalioglobus lutimaris]